MNSQKRTLAAHVLHALITATKQGRTFDIELFSARRPVSRADVRRVVDQLHREGMVDSRMRPTLAGFAIGSALLRCKLPSLREPTPARATPHAAAA